MDVCSVCGYKKDSMCVPIWKCWLSIRLGGEKGLWVGVV